MKRSLIVAAAATFALVAAAHAGGESRSLVDQARAALVAWTDAQNGAAADDYFALYDPVAFVGIKRTAGGAVKRYDFAAWKRERSNMLTKGAVIRVDGIVPRDVAAPQEVALEFVQRYGSHRYADHGRKLLRWAVRDGRLRIVAEEMLDSAPGWDDDATTARVWFDDGQPPKPAPTVDAHALTSPLTLRIVGERLHEDPPLGLARVILRDAAVREQSLGFGVLANVDEGDYAGIAPSRPRPFEHTFWWAGAGNKVVLERRGDTLVVRSAWVQEETPSDGPWRDVARIRLPSAAKLIAATK